MAALQTGTTSRLAAAIARSLSHAPNGTELHVLRPGQAHAWLVSITPLPIMVGAAFGSAALRCCVWVADMDTTPLSGARFAALFGLTPAEQRVAAGLLCDLCPKEIARAHDIALATVRTQIQVIFGKLGVQRQAELVRLLSRMEALPTSR